MQTENVRSFSQTRPGWYTFLQFLPVFCAAIAFINAEAVFDFRTLGSVYVAKFN